MWPYYAMLGAAIVAGVIGQVLLRAGAGADSFLQQLFAPHTIVGLFFYGVAALLYIVALRKLPVSIAFPSVSLSYVVVAMIGHFYWHEPIGLCQIAGLVLIIGGVVLINQH
jgi:multidrug transporter EmrE-like cation transporter